MLRLGLGLAIALAAMVVPPIALIYLAASFDFVAGVDWVVFWSAMAVGLVGIFLVVRRGPSRVLAIVVYGAVFYAVWLVLTLWFGCAVLHGCP